MSRPLGLRFQCSRAPKRANKASRRIDPLCLEFGEYEDVDAEKIDLLLIYWCRIDRWDKKMKIYLFIFLSFQICTGEIIKSDKWLCHYRCYESQFPANERRGTSYCTQRSIMTSDHRIQIESHTFLKQDVVAFPVFRTCNLALVWQTALPSWQLSRIS